jgi:hypothetical protein
VRGDKSLDLLDIFGKDVRFTGEGIYIPFKIEGSSEPASHITTKKGLAPWYRSIPDVSLSMFLHYPCLSLPSPTSVNKKAAPAGHHAIGGSKR